MDSIFQGVTRLENLGSRFVEQLKELVQTYTEESLTDAQFSALFETSLNTFEEGSSQPQLNSYFKLITTVMMNGEKILEGRSCSIPK